MKRLVLPLLATALALPLTAFASSSHSSAAKIVKDAAMHYPIVVVHPAVQDGRNMTIVKLRQLPASGVMLLSPTRLALTTSGSGNCPWWPMRLTVRGPNSIKIDMRIRKSGHACFADLVRFPIAVKIDPRIVNVHHPLTVRLAYKVHYCCGEGTRQWHRTAVAPAIHRF